ncbi:hypothetical protein ACFSTD_00835 [Novosphingobium colocasiae]
MSGQLGFADHVVAGKRSRRMDHLSQIDGLIDWGEVRCLLGRAAIGAHRASALSGAGAVQGAVAAALVWLVGRGA